MDNEAIQNLVNDYASELGVLHSNLVIERANNRTLSTQLDKAKQELKELKNKQDNANKQDTTKED